MKHSESKKRMTLNPDLGSFDAACPVCGVPFDTRRAQRCPVCGWLLDCRRDIDEPGRDGISIAGYYRQKFGTEMPPERYRVVDGVHYTEQEVIYRLRQAFDDAHISDRFSASPDRNDTEGFHFNEDGFFCYKNFRSPYRCDDIVLIRCFTKEENYIEWAEDTKLWVGIGMAAPGTAHYDKYYFSPPCHIHDLHGLIYLTPIEKNDNWEVTFPEDPCDPDAGGLQVRDDASVLEDAYRAWTESPAG